MKIKEFSFNAIDWLADSGLGQVSAAARGVWVDIMCRMWISDKPGYLVLGLNTEAPTISEIAKACRVTVPEARNSLDELERYGVFSRTQNGVIFSPRIVRELLSL